jgi:hypothetical protein
MKTAIIINRLAGILATIALLPACSKDNFLDTKPSSNLVVPSTLSDFQAILDNDGVMSQTPGLGEVSADNYYLTYAFWQGLDSKEQNAYTWAADIYQGQGGVDDWNIPYKQVFYANIVLDGLPNVSKDSNLVMWETVKGEALFLRAYAFFNLAQIFAPVYDSSSAANDMGIPLRLSSNVKAVSTRASVQQTYAQILQDLVEASQLLPAPLPLVNRNRASKPAAMALLARVCLSMRNYHQAGLYADSCIRLYATLIDYNTLDTTAVFPFTNLNTETLYQTSLLQSSQVLLGLIYPDCIVDSGLYASYAPNDLRHAIYYHLNANGLPNLKGSYNGTVFPFSGLAVDEAYLTRAESEAREGNTTKAMADLNTLLQTRWKTGTFIPFTAASPAQALAIILTERRKELAFRGLRWTDLRRLNKEGAAIVLTRQLNGQAYTLPPNDPLYVLPIPPDEIAQDGLPQNPR